MDEPVAPPPRVAVVVPTYNSAPYVAQTLDSVCAQTFPSWELVVFDDGSTDSTVGIAREFERRDRRIRVLEGVNGGVASARNRGFAETSPGSEFVIFLDNDDLWEPDALESLVAELDVHPEYVSAHAIARCIDDEGRQPELDDLEEHLRNRQGFGPAGVISRAPGEATTFADLAHSNWAVTPGVHLIRRDVLTAVGGFDADAVPCDDWDMNVRVSRRGDIGYVDRPLLHWRRHADAQSYRSPGWRRGYFYVRRKMVADPSNTPEQARIARLGYGLTGAGLVREVRERLARHDYAAAGRRLAGGLTGVLHYAWANVTARVTALRHRSRR